MAALDKRELAAMKAAVAKRAQKRSLATATGEDSAAGAGGGATSTPSSPKRKRQKEAETSAAGAGGAARAGAARRELTEREKKELRREIKQYKQEIDKLMEQEIDSRLDQLYGLVVEGKRDFPTDDNIRDVVVSVIIDTAPDATTDEELLGVYMYGITKSEIKRIIKKLTPDVFTEEESDILTDLVPHELGRSGTIVSFIDIIDESSRSPEEKRDAIVQVVDASRSIGVDKMIKTHQVKLMNKMCDAVAAKKKREVLNAVDALLMTKGGMRIILPLTVREVVPTATGTAVHTRVNHFVFVVRRTPTPLMIIPGDKKLGLELIAEGFVAIPAGSHAGAATSSPLTPFIQGKSFFPVLQGTMEKKKRDVMAMCKYDVVIPFPPMVATSTNGAMSTGGTGGMSALSSSSSSAAARMATGPMAPHVNRAQIPKTDARRRAEIEKLRKKMGNPKTKAKPKTEVKKKQPSEEDDDDEATDEEESAPPPGPAPTPTPAPTPRLSAEFKMNVDDFIGLLASQR